MEGGGLLKDLFLLFFEILNRRWRSVRFDDLEIAVGFAFLGL